MKKINLFVVIFTAFLMLIAPIANKSFIFISYLSPAVYGVFILFFIRESKKPIIVFIKWVGSFLAYTGYLYLFIYTLVSQDWDFAIFAILWFLANAVIFIAVIIYVLVLLLARKKIK